MSNIIKKKPRITLSCWPIGGGEVAIQTNTPAHRKTLKRLKGFRLASWSVADAYLAVFHGPMSLKDAEAFIAKHETSDVRAISSEESISQRLHYSASFAS